MSQSRVTGQPRPIPSRSTSWIFQGHYFGLIHENWAENKIICNLCHPIELPDPTPDKFNQSGYKGLIDNSTTVAINHLRIKHTISKMFSFLNTNQQYHLKLV